MSCIVQRIVYAAYALESCHCFLTSRTMEDLHHVCVLSGQLFYAKLLTCTFILNDASSCVPAFVA